MAVIHTTMMSASRTAYSTAVGPSSPFRKQDYALRVGEELVIEGHIRLTILAVEGDKARRRNWAGCGPRYQVSRVRRCWEVRVIE
jgi:hypothetical protein